MMPLVRSGGGEKKTHAHTHAHAEGGGELEATSDPGGGYMSPAPDVGVRQ